MSNGFVVTVKLAGGVQFKDLNYDDTQECPVGAYTFPQAVTASEALDSFHLRIPVSCLEDFCITCEEGTWCT